MGRASALPKLNMDNQQIIDKAIDDAVNEKKNIVESPRELVERVTNNFIKAKIDDFPRMCAVAGVMNAEKKKQLMEIGRKGKFTDTYGWTEDGSMLADYDIPQDLYNFMQVFVYKDFWSNSNDRIWRGFMKKICASGMTDYDAMSLFAKLQKHFGDTKLVKVS